MFSRIKEAYREIMGTPDPGPDKFCRDCGKPLMRKSHAWGFDPKTGEQIVRTYKTCENNCKMAWDNPYDDR